MITINLSKVDTIVVSTQHDDFDEEVAMLAKIKQDVKEILIPRVKGNTFT
jgi:S-adenosylmethionine synthetase